MSPEMQYIVKMGPANIRKAFDGVRQPVEKDRPAVRLCMIATAVVMCFIIAGLVTARHQAQAEVFKLGDSLLVAPVDQCKATTAFGPSK